MLLIACGAIKGAGGHALLLAEAVTQAFAAAHTPTLAPALILIGLAHAGLALPPRLSLPLAGLLRCPHAGHVLLLAGSVAHAAPHAGIGLIHISLHTAFAAHAAFAAGARAHAFRACMVIVRHMNLLMF